MSAYPSALLALADGTVFHGKGIGAVGSTVGEVVFNTSMSGYQEILTDPSYSRQIVTLTYPHIGNTGVNTEDVESFRVHAAGLVIRDLPILPSNFRMTQRLDAYLKAEGVVAIAGLDTRKLTRLLREELPYALTVEIEQFIEDERLVRIHAVVWVERASQKGIVIGERGATLREVGRQARQDMERLLGRKVFLETWVKVREGWSDDERALRSLGYADPGAR